MFFVFPDGGFSEDETPWALLTDRRPPFVAAEEGLLAAELAREDWGKEWKFDLS